MHVLPPEDEGLVCYQATKTAHFCHTRAGLAVLQTSVILPGSEGEGHENALNSGARRGQAKLHSPVIHQVELHISTTETHKTYCRHLASCGL